MAKCKFKTDDGWECPLDAEPGKDYCYWHKRENGKSPNKNQLEVLKKHRIKGAYLRRAHLEGVDLSFAHFEEADLRETYLEGAELLFACLEGTNLIGAHLEGANLVLAKVNGKTDFTGTYLNYSNLSFSYIDGTKTLRNAKFDSKTEINEIVAGLLKKKDIKLTIPIINKTLTLKRINTVILDAKQIEKNHPELYKFLRIMGSQKYAKLESVFFFNKEKKCFENHPGECIKTKKTYDPVIKKIAENLHRYLLLKNSSQDKNHQEHEKDLIIQLYEASYDVFNMLYYFYIQNGKLEKAFEMHRKRSDVRRKLLMAKGGLKNKIRAILYDWFILKFLTGYGLNVFRPILLSFLTIITFTMLFWATGGIVKRIDNIYYKPDFWDYLYHSVTTFTSLGYSNIVPNLKIGHLAQGLVATESVLGVFLIALIIFTITYRISK